VGYGEATGLCSIEAWIEECYLGGSHWSWERNFFFLPFREQMTGFHDLLRENTYSLLMLGWSCVSVASL
jgi:hypothetical protein